MPGQENDNKRQEGAAQRRVPADEEEAPPAPSATAGVGGGAPGIATPRSPGGALPSGGPGTDPDGTDTGDACAGEATIGVVERDQESEGAG